MNKRGRFSKNMFMKNPREQGSIIFQKKNSREQGSIIFQKKNSRGQVWVETVIYLLIAFVMIGLVLSFIKPKIEQIKDKAIIEQSIQIIQDIDNSILTMGGSGNKRLLEIGIKKGSLIIDSENDTIIFEMEGAYMYSEPGETVKTGNIEAVTEKNGRNNRVTLKRDFGDEYNITYNDEESTKTLTRAPSPYRMFITNNGISLNKINIDFSVE
jgi:hypothetical protein